jgi:hypothetical protein
LTGRGSRWHSVYAPSAPIDSPSVFEIDRYGPNDDGIDEDSLWAYYAAAIRSGMPAIKASLAERLGSPDPARAEPASTTLSP